MEGLEGRRGLQTLLFGGEQKAFTEIELAFCKNGESGVESRD